ncbi:hypothetical protein Taro_028389 [Colocasia esculenta]|uniref:Uncharacterized protein n=1 Tax=Colocasia esculenta TaxID=4460 RepID=A0A843VGC8_COLES|nr:hypothetical protein [Colocasia esculenta]
MSPKTEADGTLTSMVKGTQIRITRDLLASLFEVSTTGYSGVHSVDTQVKGLGIIGPDFRLKDGKLDINRLIGDVSEKMGQAIRSRNLRKSGFSTVNGVWSKTGAVEGEAIIGEAQEDLEPVAEAAAVVKPEEAAIDQVVPAAAVTAAAEEEASSRIEDIPPDFIEPFGQSPDDHLPSSQVDTLLRNALDSISQEEQVASESLVAESVAEGHTEEMVIEEAPSQQEHVSVQVDAVMEDAPIEGQHSVAEDIQGESVVASGHTEVPSEDLPIQSEVAAAAQPNVPMEIVAEEEEVSVEKGSETQGEGNENPPENQFREGETASSSDSEDDDGDLQAPVDQGREKGKEVPLLAKIPYQRSRIGAQAPPPPPAQPSKGNEEEVARPSGPSDQESGPSGSEIISQAAAVESGPSEPEIVSPEAAVESGPSGPSDQGSGPSGPVGSEQILAEEAAVSLEPPAPSPT